MADSTSPKHAPRVGLIAGLALCLASSMTGCDGAAREARAASAGTYEEDAPPESLPDFTLRWLFGVGMGHKLHFAELQLYYVDPITEQQARATGSFLRHLGIGDRETLAQLRQIRGNDATSPAYELRIGTPYARKELIDRETRTVYQFMALSAEGALFDGAPVQVSICNSLLQPLLILRPRLKPAVEKDAGAAVAPPATLNPAAGPAAGPASGSFNDPSFGPPISASSEAAWIPVR